MSALPAGADKMKILLLYAAPFNKESVQIGDVSAENAPPVDKGTIYFCNLNF